MKQTAVEWLVNELKSNKKKHLGYKNIDIDFKNIIEQAIQMEKQDKHSEYMRGWKDGYSNQELKSE